MDKEAIFSFVSFHTRSTMKKSKSCFRISWHDKITWRHQFKNCLASFHPNKTSLDGWQSLRCCVQEAVWVSASRQSWINCQVDSFAFTKWVDDNVQQPPYISAALTLTGGTRRHTLWGTLRLTLSELQWYPFIICTRALLHALACFTVLSTASLWR